MDKIDHPFTTETDKGGSRFISYGFNKDGRKGRQGTRGSRHIIGVNTVNAGGKVLPPLFIFDSSDQNCSNIQVQASWCDDLPKICYLFIHVIY